MTDTTTGGTVRYHRAKWEGHKSPDLVVPWRVQYVEDGKWHWFSAAEGEAMGLTPPPAPFVVTCNGHSVDLSDEVVTPIVRQWADERVEDWPNGSLILSAVIPLARLLRDARQDPQPASDDHYEAWKSDMAKWKADRDERDAWQETARQYAQNADYWRDRLNDHKASLAIQAFTAPDEDEAVMMESLVARIADLQAKVDLHSAPAAPVSPYEGLRAVLAGRDDADELLFRCANGNMPTAVMQAVRDAARSGGAT
jgi:hypothetical protein